MPNGGQYQAIWIQLETILDRRTWVYYLIILEAAVREWGERIQVRPDERFFKAVGEHVEAYVKKGVMPPKEIAPAIMNMADDFMSGRDITIRAGDYISLQEFFH